MQPVNCIYISDESNPPEVWRFIESIADKWSCLALFMGYENEYMAKIKSQCSSVDDQISLFMRVWRVPNCRGQTRQILDKLRKAFEEPAPGNNIVVMD